MIVLYLLLFIFSCAQGMANTNDPQMTAQLSGNTIINLSPVNQSLPSTIAELTQEIETLIKLLLANTPYAHIANRETLWKKLFKKYQKPLEATLKKYEASHSTLPLPSSSKNIIKKLALSLEITHPIKVLENKRELSPSYTIHNLLINAKFDVSSPSNLPYLIAALLGIKNQSLLKGLALQQAALDALRKNYGGSKNKSDTYIQAAKEINNLYERLREAYYKLEEIKAEQMAPTLLSLYTENLNLI